MPDSGQLYDRIMHYLKGKLSNRERHDLEREMLQDHFDEEAFEGLNHMHADDLKTDMDLLISKLDKRIRKRKIITLNPILRIAAALLIIAGAGILLYSILRTPPPELLTQENGKQEQVNVPETSIPEPPDIPDRVDRNKPSGSIGEEVSTILPGNKKKDEENQPNNPVIISNQTAAALADAESRSTAYPESDLAKTSASVPAASDSLRYGTGYITGRVLGVNRQALAGVSIMEEGATQGTLTDANGNFRLKIRDSRSRLEVNYIGYKSVEIPSKEITGKEILLDEERVTPNDLLVLNYGSDKKSKAASPVFRKSETEIVKSDADVYRRPVPPGGSMKEFEVWVEERIDTMQLKELLPGQYKIRVKLTVNRDGTVSNLSVPDDIPVIVADEYKRAVLLSERWQPAMADNLPVDAEVMIEFMLTIK